MEINADRERLEKFSNRNVSMVMLTGVSGSGKTTLKDYLLETYPDRFAQPIQYTTRERRFDTELDEYVFLDKETFFRKLDNGDFCEHTKYDGNYYALGKYLPSGKTSIGIFEPVGREEMRKFCTLERVPYVSVYLSIPPDVMEHRLGLLRRSSVDDIRRRKRDYDFFTSYGSDMILDGTRTTKELADEIVHHLDNVGFQRIATNGV